MERISNLRVAALSALALATAWIISAPRACAQDEAAGAASLEEVKVTAQRLEQDLPQDLAAAGVEVDTLQGQAVHDGGYQDVAGALAALAPGLFIIPKNGPFDYVQISMLGSRTEDVLWLVDGVRINNRLYSGTTPLDTLPSGIVDHLEVLQGGQALFYGTQAVAGAVNIVTKPFSNSANGAATLSADTNNSRHLDFNFADGVGIGQLVLYGSADKSSGYQSFRTQDYQPSSTQRDRGYDVTTLGGKYGVDFSPRVRLEASWQHTDADLDYALPYRVARDVNARREDLASLKLDIQASDRLGLFIKSYYHNWHTTYDTFYNDLATPGILDDLYQGAFWGYKDYGVNALGKFDLTPGLQLYFGYDLQRYGGRDEVLVITQHDEQTQAGFAQLRLTPALVPHLTLAGGLRYNSPSVGEQATIWNLSGLYALPADLYLKGEAGTNFRLPDAEELFANDPEDERGDPNLKPEKSRSLNLSFGGRFGPAAAIHWQLTGFARDIDDLIDYASYDATTGQDVFGNVPGTVRVRGGEGLIEAALGTSLSANVNYTYSHSTEDSAQQIADVPRDLFKAGVDYHPATLPFGATATVNYVGDTTTPVLGEQIHYGRYALVDLSARYYVDAQRHQQLNFSIRNLLDRQYGRPGHGCADVPTDGPYDCSSPYIYVNLGLPRTFAASYEYRFF
ncbi:MAG TPA: TonB-dependent receptor [Steroidobacteraceae bacterium]|nr:TonB-dependent receptor [Steroidobacteraceae bacterium]